MADNNGKKDADFRFEIIKSIGVLSTNAKGWSKELNLVSWNGRDAKYDIREWSPDHLKMGKGITMTDAEFIKLSEILSSAESETSGSNLYDFQENVAELSA